MQNQNQNTFISIISPVYKAEKIIDILVENIIKEVSKITENFEIILVEDGSPDECWEGIERNHQKDSRVKGIKLSRNFGQYHATTAGLDEAKGEWIIVMDCDLQDSPEEIINLYNKAQTGYDIVLASRENRQDNFFKCLGSWAFYKVLSFLTNTNYDSSIASFGIYHRKVVDTLRKMKENIRVFPVMVQWIGFNKTKLAVKHQPRAEGQSTYNLKRLLNLALNTILAYSDKPIKLIIQFGFLIFLLTLIFAFWTIIQYCLGQIQVFEYISLIISVWLIASLMMMTMGIIGLYIIKTFDGVKNRPIYIIDKKLI